MTGGTPGSDSDGLPLSGVTVVSLEQAVAGPFATRQLADLGARVIKIERPATGDFARGYDASVSGMSSFFVWLNRGKQSVTLNLKDSRGRDILEQALERADVFVQNLAPGASRRLGFSWDQLRVKYPALICCDVSGYGPNGPWSDRKAYDLLVQCEVGLPTITGTAEHPAKVGISVADIAAGMYAFSGILAALLQRKTTGRGHHVSISLLESLAEWMGAPLMTCLGSGSPPVPAGLAHSTIHPYGPYPTGDGMVVIAVQTEREFAILCDQILGAPQLLFDDRFRNHSGRIAHRTDLDRMIEAVTRTFDAESLTSKLSELGIANARLNDIQGLIENPQLSARQRWVTVETPEGTIPALRPPIDLDEMRLVMGPVPDLGEHSAAILGELGFESRSIDELRTRGVI